MAERPCIYFFQAFVTFVIPGDYIVFYSIAFLGFLLYFTFGLHALSYLEDLYGNTQKKREDSKLETRTSGDREKKYIHASVSRSKQVEASRVWPAGQVPSY